VLVVALITGQGPPANTGVLQIEKQNNAAKQMGNICFMM
jgi:hypothetical protein